MFGDHDDADAYDTAPPDRSQIALKLRELRAEWSDETTVGRLLAAWLDRQGPSRG